MLETGISIAVALISAGIILLQSKSCHDRPGRHALTIVGCALLVPVWHVSTFYEVLAGSAKDNFFDLGITARTGLVVLSLTLITIVLSLSICKSSCLIKSTHSRPGLRLFVTVADLGFSWMIFGLLYSLATQIYYFYYLLVIPQLPLQWVVEFSTGFKALVRFLTMDAIQQFGELLASSVFWLLSLVLIWQHLIKIQLKSVMLARWIVPVVFGGGCFAWQLAFN